MMQDEIGTSIAPYGEGRYYSGNYTSANYR